MTKETIAMSEEELQRLGLMELVEEGNITLKEAGEKMGVSYRQAKRLRKKVKKWGPRGLVHGGRGRPATNRIGPEVRQRVLFLSAEFYGGFNDTHFTEMLKEREGIELSRETVRKLRRGSGQAPKRSRRAPRHRKRRERMAQEGLMMLWDGSPHRWFGPEHPSCSLMVSVDDATGKILAARFFPFEGSYGYLWLLRRVAKGYGIPLSVYQDRHGSLKRNDSNWSVEEELDGRREPTQVGAALEALAIRPIFALSPQAKGRVERLFGTLQDRLAAELAFNGIHAIEEANKFLEAEFIKRYNCRFALKARQTAKAWRKPPGELERKISFKYAATVANDNTVSLGGIVIDILRGPSGRSYAKARVEVRQLLNGAWRVYYGEKLIAKHRATEPNEPIRALTRKYQRTKSQSWVYLKSKPHDLTKGTFSLCY